MIDELKPYPEYKNSGVEWLGEVPGHWEVRKLKYVVSFTGGGTPSKGVSAYWQGDVPWVSPKDMSRAVLDDTSDHISHEALRSSATSLVPPGAVLLVVRSGVLRRKIPVAINRVPMALNQDMKALRPKRELAIPAYVVALIQGNQGALLSEWTKQGATVESIEHELLANSPIPLPPFPEQTAIVRFLDYVDRRVRRVIRARQRLVKLLEEYKQALIHQAVTGRIDARTGEPYPEYKDSGVEWLGEVPAHWTRKRLRQCVSIVGGMTPRMDVHRYWNGNVPWVTPKDMKQLLLSDSSMKVTSDALTETALKLVKPPAVLMVVRGMILARRVPIAVTTVPVTINQDMKALLPKRGLDAKFLAHFLSSVQEAFVPMIDEAGHGTRRLPTERWRELEVLQPPVPEQTAIVRFLDEQTASLDRAAGAARREIDLLEEFRTRLIADVVTGKLDVREVAARLPEEEDESEPLDELGAGAGVGGGAGDLDETPVEAEA